MFLIRIVFIFLFLVTTSYANPDYGKFKPIEFAGKTEIIITPWHSSAGLEKLANSKYKNDFYQLAHHFTPQSNPLYCGIASTTIILNALKQGSNDIPNSKNSITKPEAYGGSAINFLSYSQADIFNRNTQKIKAKEVIDFAAKDPNLAKYDPGLTLAQLSGFMQAHHLKTRKISAIHNDKKSLNKFRKNLKKYLNDKSVFIVANFQGKKIGSLTGGHISPIVAYEQDTDEIMILDVAAHKQPWYWVKLAPFYAAMHAKDGNFHRGYLLIENN